MKSILTRNSIYIFIYLFEITTITPMILALTTLVRRELTGVRPPLTPSPFSSPLNKHNEKLLATEACSHHLCHHPPINTITPLITTNTQLQVTSYRSLTLTTLVITPRPINTIISLITTNAHNEKLRAAEALKASAPAFRHSCERSGTSLGKGWLTLIKGVAHPY